MSSQGNLTRVGWIGTCRNLKLTPTQQGQLEDARKNQSIRENELVITEMQNGLYSQYLVVAGNPTVT